MKVRPTHPAAAGADINGGPQPYTREGLGRLTCGRPGCTRKAAEQFLFRSCAIGGSRVHVPLCKECDAELNELVLRFFDWPGVDIDLVMADYRRRGVPANATSRPANRTPRAQKSATSAPKRPSSTDRAQKSRTSARPAKRARKRS